MIRTYETMDLELIISKTHSLLEKGKVEEAKKVIKETHETINKDYKQTYGA